MTPGERSLWRALFAAHWNESTGGPAGVVDDCDRARYAARQASRALDALRAAIRKPLPSERAPSLQDADEVLE